MWSEYPDTDIPRYPRTLRIFISLLFFCLAGTIPAFAQESWNRLPGPYMGLYQSHFIDPVTRNIYVFMYVGEVYRSTDMGESWQRQIATDSTPLECTSIVREGSRLWGILTGGSISPLYRSDDNGETWSVVSRTYTGGNKVTSIAIASPYIIYGTSGNDRKHYISSDSGKTFRMVWGNTQPGKEPLNNEWSVFFNYRGTLMALSNRRLYQTTDGGAFWTRVSEEGGPHSEAGYVNQIVGIIDSTIIVRAYASYANNRISYHRTSNLGKTWEEFRVFHKSDDVNMHCDGNILYLYIKSDSTYRSTDMGDSWERLDLHPPYFFSRFIELPSGEFIVGQSSPNVTASGWYWYVEGLNLSRKNGTEWLNVGGNTTRDLNDIEVDDGTVYAAGRYHWKNVDGSHQWQLIAPELPKSNDILVRNHDTMWIATPNSLLRSDNRGDTWEQMFALNPDRNMSSLLSFQGYLFFGGHSGISRYLYRSGTQGLRWTALNDSTFPFNSIVSENCVSLSGSLYVRGRSKKDSSLALYRSNDNGESWFVVDSTLPQYYYSRDTLIGLVSSGGRILTRYDSNSIASYQPVDSIRLEKTIIRYDAPGQTLGLFTYLNGIYYITGDIPLYAPPVPGAQVGLMRSIDGGKMWEAFGRGLSNIPSARASSFYSSNERLYLLSRNEIYYIDKEQVYSLTVENGYGSGYYPAGDTVHIWSRELDSIEVFDGWKAPVNGDDLYRLRKEGEWHTQLVMPKADLTYRAAIDSVKASASRTDTLESEIFTVITHSLIPENPKGVILLLHERNGSSADWFNRTEYNQFVRDALAADFGIVSLESGNPGEWQLQPETYGNSDAERIATVARQIGTKIPSLRGRPSFVLGMGNGGQIASLTAGLYDIYGIKAAALYCAGGSLNVYSAYSPLTIFCLASENSIADANTEAANNEQLLRAKGLSTELWTHSPSPLYRERFARISGIDTARSGQIFDEILQAGHLGPKYFLKHHPDSILQNVARNPTTYAVLSTLPSTMVAAVREQLRATYAEQEFYSDFNKTVLDFFDGILRLSSVDIDNRARSLSSALTATYSDGTLIIRYPASESEDVECTLYTLLGQAVERFSLHGERSGYIQVRLGHKLSRGNYICVIRTASGEIFPAHVPVW